MAERWNPWRALRARPEVRFARAPLPESCGGAVSARWPDGSAVIVVDPDLGYAERQAALTHELVHLERGGGCANAAMPDSWRPVEVREERTVHRISAARLVPESELRTFVERRTASEIPTTTADVAEEFGTTEHMAELSMLLLKGEVA